MNKREQAEFEALRRELQDSIRESEGNKRTYVSNIKIFVFIIIAISVVGSVLIYNSEYRISTFDKINGVTYIDNNAYVKFDLQDPVQASMLNSIIAYCTQNDLRYCMINPEVAE